MTEREFLRRYVEELTPDDLRSLHPADIEELARTHRALAATRGERPWIARVNGHDGRSGSSIDIVSADVPFLVDSVLAELLRLELPVGVVIHPVFGDGRDDESWIHVEIIRSLTAHDRDHVMRAISGVLADVHLVAASRAHIVAVAESAAAAADSEEAARLLRWACDGRFVFLGHLGPDAGTSIQGLARAEDALAAAALVDDTGVAIAKLPRRSTVHRDAYYDCLVVTTPAGAHRFIGLFTAAAYTESPHLIPVVDAKARAVISAARARPGSHTGKAIDDIIETFPRDELFRAPEEFLTGTVIDVQRAGEKRSARAYLRRDEHSPFVTCLVYLPRDWYSTGVRLRLQDLLHEQLDAATVDFRVSVSDRPLAQVYFTVRLKGPGADAAIPRDLGRRLVELASSWHDSLAARLHTLLEGDADGDIARSWSYAFPHDYAGGHTVAEAADDVLAIERARSVLAPDQTVSVLALDAVGESTAERRIRLHSIGPLTLSALLPVFQCLGVEVLDERSWQLVEPSRGQGHLIELTLSHPEWGGDLSRFIAAFEQISARRVAADRLNALVITARLTWQHVEVLRAYVRYLRQVDPAFGQTYQIDVLLAHPEFAAGLAELFAVRFGPEGPADAETRRSSSAELATRLRTDLDAIESVTADRILRALLTAVIATMRTNVYLPKRLDEHARALAIKLDTRLLPFAAPPRPTAEVWVYSADVEGVHLRFGPVARGGLRWSDRPEDFRTEVLGLAKAQSVKNAVIVPAGAKGGFVVKRDRGELSGEDWTAAGTAAYRVFVEALLDVTDDATREGAGGAIVVRPPRGLVRLDADDPYLVVAADKGTATLSDTANAIALRRGFWLGDAFASGGSEGYDHKALGITARGAWESARRHFRELGIDPEQDAITAVGIGDMSGDVFGNGMLLSSSLRLIAAFDHRHIFLDPSPQAQESFEERRRLFALPRSSWKDYRPDLISEGGGVYDRSAKHIRITPEVQAALGVQEPELTPDQLISAILRAPVDLLWNGGVGTYVKASWQSQPEAADRANDPVRVDARDLRARVVVEGGNLGLTQAARIEAARAGVRLNTDAVDNSAGVDCSDHEVNLKILIDGAIAAGRLNADRRSALLRSVSDEVSAQVLRDNYDQNLLLARARAASALMLPVQQRFLRELEAHDGLDRGIEELPDDDEIARRVTDGEGLLSPELAVLMAYAKLSLKKQLLASDVVDDRFTAGLLERYFPSSVVATVGETGQHPLRREIVATALANEIVNVGGLTFVFRAQEETGASTGEIARAWAVSCAIFDSDLFRAEVRRLDGLVDPAVQTKLLWELRRLLDRAVRWFLRVQGDDDSVERLIERYGALVRPLLGTTADLVLGDERDSVTTEIDRLVAAGVPRALAERGAALLYEFRFLDVAEIALTGGRRIDEVATTYMAVSDRYEVARILQRIAELPRTGRWETLGRSSLRSDLEEVVSEMTQKVLSSTPEGTAEAIEQWESDAEGALVRARSALSDVHRLHRGDFAAISVSIRLFREAVERSRRRQETRSASVSEGAAIKD
jgi:glutamate dehydrogenase